MICRFPILFTVSGIVLAAALVWGFLGLPGFGHYPGPYGDWVNASVVPERNVTNAPTAVNFDYRALDTLGEEFILFASVAAVALLLRMQWEQVREKSRPAEPSPARFGTSPAVEWLGSLFAAPMALYGIYVILHGQLTPGGGFHGGVIVASAAILFYLTRGARTFHRLSPQHANEAVEALAAGSYAVIGLACMLAGGAAFENVLSPGTYRSITSGGTIALLNLAVGVEVAGAFTLLFAEFIKELLQKRETA